MDGWAGLGVAFVLLGMPIGIGYAFDAAGVHTGVAAAIVLLVLWFTIGAAVIRRLERR